MNESRTIPSLHTYMNSIHVYILRTEYRVHTVHICSVLHAWMLYYYPSTRIRAALRTWCIIYIYTLRSNSTSLLPFSLVVGAHRLRVVLPPYPITFLLSTLPFLFCHPSVVVLLPYLSYPYYLTAYSLLIGYLLGCWPTPNSRLCMDLL